MNDKVLPLAAKFGENKTIQAVSGGLMYTLPLTLCAALFSILAKFPIPAVEKWFTSLGLTEHFNAILGGTLNIIALFIAVSIPYTYTKIVNKSNTNPLMAGMLSLATFIILMPQTVNNGKIAALAMDNLGSQGMFVAIIVGILIAKLYVQLCGNKKLLVKMPKGVPPMVSQSFEPLLIAIIIIFLAFLVRVGISATPFDSIFSVINMVIADPLLKLGSSAPAWIFIAFIANALFFFGIHPNVVNSALVPILITMAYSNIAAFQAGTTMQYRTTMITNSFLQNDATGSTLSLLIAIFIFCKSKRYRSFAKFSVVPNFFNVNEPIIFGLPIMLNPILFLPYLLSTLITGFIGYLGAITGFISYYNPILSLGLPWTTPKIIGSFLTMGWQGLALRLFSMAVMVVVYLPFMKILDRQELIKEKLPEENKQKAAIKEVEA